MDTKHFTFYVFITILMIGANTSNCYSQTYEDFLAMIDEEDGPVLTQENKVELGFPAEYTLVLLKDKRKLKAKKMRGCIELAPSKKMKRNQWRNKLHYSFEEFTGLNAIKMENDLLTVEFSNCTDLEYADLSKFKGWLGIESVMKIKKDDRLSRNYLQKAFKNCVNLKRVLLPENYYQVIGEETFYGCKNLKMHIPLNIRKIGKSAFKYCMNMPKTQYFGETVALEDSVFAKTNIKRLIFHGLDTSKESFAEMDSLEEIKNDTDSYDRFMDDERGILRLPSLKSLKKINLYASRYIDADSSSFPHLEEVYIKGGGILGFNNCPNLRVVHIENYCRGIYGFNNCPNLEEVYIGGTVGCLKGFNNCPKIKKIKFKVKEFGNVDGFSNCDSLQRVKIEYDPKTVHLCGFMNCKNLSEVIFESALPYYIGTRAFANCPKLDKSFMNSYVTNEPVVECNSAGIAISGPYYRIKKWGDTIKEHTENGLVYQYYYKYVEGAQLKGFTSDFNYYHPDGNVEVPDSLDICGKKVNVISIHEDVFKGNNQITSVSLPNTIRETFEGCFADCRFLRKVRLPENHSFNVIQRDFFKGCTSLEEIYIPSNVTHIHSRAFAGCENLHSIKSNTIRSLKISDNAFRDCFSLTDIQLDTKTKQAIETSIYYDEYTERREYYQYVEDLGNQIEGIIASMREAYIYGGVSANKKIHELTTMFTVQ